jgi:hypothetical protein
LIVNQKRSLRILFSSLDRSIDRKKRKKILKPAGWLVAAAGGKMVPRALLSVLALLLLSHLLLGGQRGFLDLVAAQPNTLPPPEFAGSIPFTGVGGTTFIPRQTLPNFGQTMSDAHAGVSVGNGYVAGGLSSGNKELRVLGYGRGGAALVDKSPAGAVAQGWRWSDHGNTTGLSLPEPPNEGVPLYKASSAMLVVDLDPLWEQYVDTSAAAAAGSLGPNQLTRWGAGSASLASSFVIPGQEVPLVGRPHHGARTPTSDLHLVVAGGTAGQVQASVLNISTLEWRAGVPDLPVPTVDGGKVSYGPYALMTGGSDSPYVMHMNATESFQFRLLPVNASHTPFVTWSCSVGNLALFAFNNYVEVDIFDISSGVKHPAGQAPDLSLARANPGVAVVNGICVFAGGKPGGLPEVNTVDMYDLRRRLNDGKFAHATGSLSKKRQILTGAFTHYAALFAGGNNAGDGTTIKNIVDWLDPIACFNARNATLPACQAARLQNLPERL